MIKPIKLNQDAIIAWMFVMECYEEYGSLKKGGVLDLGCKLMKHYSDEFETIQMVYRGIRATREGQSNGL